MDNKSEQEVRLFFENLRVLVEQRLRYRGAKKTDIDALYNIDHILMHRYFSNKGPYSIDKWAEWAERTK